MKGCKGEGATGVGRAGVRVFAKKLNCGQISRRCATNRAAHRIFCTPGKCNKSADGEQSRIYLYTA